MEPQSEALYTIFALLAAWIAIGVMCVACCKNYKTDT